jgi:hypothetical protein
MVLVICPRCNRTEEREDVEFGTTITCRGCNFEFELAKPKTKKASKSRKNK